MTKWLLNVYISYLYVQTITHQCFCFPNSQWGATAHDIPPQREDRKLDILENISFCLQNRNMPWKSNIHMLFIQSVLTVQQNQSELGLMPMEYLKVALN